MLPDSDLQRHVLAALAWEPSVDAAHLGVTANDGVVTLTGHVTSFLEKHAATAAAARVRGVRAVAEDIDVRLAFDMSRGDDDIAAAALHRLSWDVSVPRDAVRVEVDAGWVTLSGVLDWHYQQEAAEQDIRGLYGVTGITNHTTLKPRIDTAKIQEDITHALNRSWFGAPDTIVVTARDGRVHLTGKVHSWHERQIAADAAWGAPGTIAVENDLAIV